ncbi:MAG: hypothetical protein GY835_01645 [bacterium]|nr:hypothetical protein [bacterium]
MQLRVYPALLLITLTLLLHTSFVSPLHATEAEIVLPLTAAWNPATPSGRLLSAVVDSPETDRADAPKVTWWWLLDDGERIAAADLFDRNEELLCTDVRMPRTLPLIGDEGRETVIRGGEPLLNADYVVKISDPRTLHGQTVQAITVIPLRISDGDLFGLKGASLRLHTESATAVIDKRSSEHPEFPLRERVLRGLQGRLLNPELLPLTSTATGIFDRAVGGEDFPMEIPNIEGSLVEMVIVTIDSMVDLCEDFAEAKTRMGIPTAIRTVEWISTHYPHGSDRPEMIRNFVIDAYEKWGIKYLLLVGDSDQIPPRYVYTEIFSPFALSPTDLYYGCLDGDWNADHDNNWGEALDLGGHGDDDQTDFLPEVIVGRLPASTRSECAALLGKSKRYQDCIGDSYHDRILMLGEVLFPSEWIPGQAIIYDGAQFCDNVIVSSTDERNAITALYENYYDYPYSEDLTRQAALDSMANGYGVVLHNGHGARQTMSVGDGSLDATMVGELDNGNRSFLLYMVNCTAAAFDYSCIAEAFLKNPDGGASSVIGSTRETFPTFSGTYMDAFFNILYSDSSLSLGEVYTAGLNSLEPETHVEGGYRWAHSTFTLLADPSSWLHYARLETLTVDYPNSVNLHTETCTITISDSDDNAVPGVLVTIFKLTEDIQSAVTDELGQVEFTLKAESPGFYSINTSKRDTWSQNYIFSSYIDSTPLLSIVDTGLHATGEVAGAFLDNGIPDRGETFELGLSLANAAGSDAHNVGVMLTSEHAAVTIHDPFAAFPDIAVQGSAACSDSFLVELGNVPDDEIIPFLVEITTDEGVFQEEFFLEAAAPLHRLHRTLIDDSTSGNNNGLMEIGEIIVVPLWLANEGRGAGYGITPVLSAPEGSGLSILYTDLEFGTTPPLAVGIGPCNFVVQCVGPEEPMLELQLIDAYGYTETIEFSLLYPADMTEGPSFVFTTQPDKMVLEWTSPGGGNNAGYVVHRADAPDGPYEEVSRHVVPHSTYEDDDLDSYTQYWYRVQAISSGGLVGGLSDSTSVISNLGSKSGWPVYLGQETPSTPVVADVNGDSTYEIIIGSDLLYAFNLDGSELGDGDLDPDTIGPASAVGERFFCSLSATDLTDSPGVEIVAGSWNTGEVIVFEFTDTENGCIATPAPGWPRPIGYPSGYGIWGTPTLGDIDGDGDMEIFVADVGGIMNAWHHDGTEVRNGDGNPETQGIYKTGLGGWPRSSVAFGDINGDDKMEPVFCSATGVVYSWREDGHPVMGFPFTTPYHSTEHRGIFSSPVLGDVDGDDELEIIFACENDSLYMLNHDGTLAEGWPIHWFNNNVSQMSPTPSLADFDDDGYPEIVSCANRSSEHMDIAVIDADGTFLPGWPQVLVSYTQASPVIVDIDGDGALEIIVGDEDGAINAWHHDGTTVGGFPMVTGDWMRATPTIMDVDEDGLLDILAVGWNKVVFLWETGTVFDPETAPWYTFMHDQKRTGNYGSLDWIVSVDDELPEVLAAVRLDPNWPNPFNPVTNIRFVVGGDETQRVELSIFDVSGRRIRVLIDEKLAPGDYRRSWRGCDDQGHKMASSVYFARLRVGDVVETRKMMLIK